MATILIVEDHAMSRQMLASLLSYAGHHVLEAVEGTGALTLAYNERPDLIISDILLPSIDGLEFVRKLRLESTLKKTPVIFYTASCRYPESIRLDETYGTCRVIPKPSDPEFILKTVSELLGAPSALTDLQTVTDVPRQNPAESSFSQIGGLQLSVLMDLSYSMVAQRDPQKLLCCIPRILLEFFNCRHSVLMIERDGGKEYFISHAQGEPAASGPDGLLPPEEILHRVVTRRLPYRWPSASSFTCETGISVESLMAVPFTSPTCVYGWICLKDKLDCMRFSDVDEEITMTLGMQAAIAYENILLLEQMKKSGEYLEELVARRTAELERANMELLKVQKLESLGVLAGGIAHDFNNELTVILNVMQLIRKKYKLDESVYPYLNMVEKTCHNAESLTRQLLTFSKGGSPVKKASLLPDLISDTAGFALRGSKVKCEFSFAPDLYVVEIDQGQISQVINNMVINADQAMPNGGVIRISADNFFAGSNDNLPISHGSYVKLSVIDQGIGIPNENLSKIFDPYFTTKEKGSGLGLATSYSIIKKHGGYITVESEEEKGTAFHIYLPASRKKTEVQTNGKEIQPGNGRILLIEDQESIADSLADLLKMYGYMADAVHDGADGLDLYRNSMKMGKPYDAVILDLTIPGGMGGKEAMKCMKDMNPDVVAIVASGYSNNPVLSNYHAYGFSGAVQKPYRIEDIVRELQRIMPAGQ